jgi:hypothetical protein
MQKFDELMKKLGFYKDDNGDWEIRNRNVAYDDDCSDDERDDSFYDRHIDRYNDWAKPIIDNILKATAKLNIKVKIETTEEYGLIMVEMKS